MSTATTHIKTEKQLIPALRFNEFEDLWRTRKLGELGSVVNGLTYSPNDINDNGTLVLRSSNVQNGALYLDDNVYVTVIEGKYNPVLVDDILICVRNGSKRLIGKNTLITEEIKGVAFGAFMAVYRSDFNRFLYYFFSSQGYYKEIHKNLGATINSINGSDLRNFKVGVPSLPEQQKIASFLSAVAEKTQQLTKKKTLLEQYKKGGLQQLFSGQLRFKDENGNPYPDWEEKRLGEYLIHKSTRNKDLSVELVLSVSNKKGFISQEEQFDGYEVASKDVSNYKIVDRDDIAYNPSRINVGSIARLINFEQGIVSPMYVIFSLKNGLNKIFFENLYNTHRFKHLIKVGCSGSVRDSLNFDDLCDFEFKFPSIEEQQKIATYLSSIDTKIGAVNNQITQTQTFKKGLLQQMFV